MGGDQRDDETARASAGKPKFLDADTHLKTAIYDGDDETVAVSAISEDAKADEPVPEAVSRVFAKAEELLADLGSMKKGGAAKLSSSAAAVADADDATIPTEDESRPDDDVTRLGRPRPANQDAEKPAVASAPASPKTPHHSRGPDEETNIAVRRAPLADGSADVMNPDSLDTPLTDKIATKPSTGSIGSSIDIGMDGEDSTVLERRNPLHRDRAETTQVESVVSELDGAPLLPTLPGHGGPLSDQPIEPGPMAAPTMPGKPLEPPEEVLPPIPAPAGPVPGAPVAAMQAPALPSSPHIPAPQMPSSPGIQEGALTGDGLQTLSTDQAPQGMPVPPHLQPRPALGAPARRSRFGAFVDSIKRIFGRGPAPAAPPPDDDDDFSGYGAGTYTVANRHVANRQAANRKAGARHRRDSDEPK